MELTVGDRVKVTDECGKGYLIGHITGISRTTAFIKPESPDVQLWFHDVYCLGYAHWDSRLTILEKAS